MYWYLSFLRPPPVALSLPTEGVVITPQVANDLRTELRLDPTEISYTWQRVHPTVSAPTRPLPLTLFAPPASTYRPLTVPLPRAARPGEKWRLGMFAPPAGTPTSISLLELSEPGQGDGVGVLGVWSEGIELRSDPASSSKPGPVRGPGGKEAKGGKKGRGADKTPNSSGGKGKAPKDDTPKQGRISRSWPTRTGELRVVEQTSFDLDKKVWDSGLALSSWLWRYLPHDGLDKAMGLHADARRVVDCLSVEDLRVVELGSGTGLVSIALAQALHANSVGAVADITATDLDSAMEIMRENIALNAEPEGSKVKAAVLDWDAPLPSWVGEGAWPGVIVAADVTYNTASFPCLVDTLDRLLNPSGDATPPLLLLAYKQRDAAERDLWGMLKGRGIGMVLVDKIRGAEEDGQVEIWVGGRDVLPDA